MLGDKEAGGPASGRAGAVERACLVSAEHPRSQLFRLRVGNVCGGVGGHKRTDMATDLYPVLGQYLKTQVCPWLSCGASHARPKDYRLGPVLS